MSSHNGSEVEMVDNRSTQNGEMVKESQATNEASTKIEGWRLHVATIGLLLSLFLANLEVTIVSTSLLAITSDLQSFDLSSWVITAYLLTFTGFMVVLSKFSDIFGRRTMLLVSLLIFVVFSAVCGASNSMIELIVCRAFQGIGGAGMYGLPIATFFDILPPAKWPAYTAYVSISLAFGLLFGPLIGGGIVDNTTWRWCFLLNVPAGVVNAVMLLISLPGRSGSEVEYSGAKEMASTYSKQTLQRIDGLGTFLLLGAGLLLITALQLAGSQYAWSSSAVIALLVVSGVIAIGFFAWEYLLSRGSGIREPVFPFRFLSNRVWSMMLLDSFFAGVAYTVAIIEIPLRFQTVNSLSPFDAGVRLLPFAFLSPFGSVISATVTSKAKVPPIYILLVTATLQTIGIALLSTVPTTQDVFTGQYGYQVLAGLGTGGATGLLVLMTPHVVELRDRAVASGAVTQMRVMGGTIGLAIVSSVMNGWLGSRLPTILTESQITSIQSTPTVISSFPEELQNAVRNIYAEGYNLQFRILIGFAAIQFLVVALMWQKKPLRVV